MSENVLSIDDIVIKTASGNPVVDGISLSIARGEVLALIGASGSGKTTVALSSMGYLRPGLFLSRGSVRLTDTDLLTAPRSMLDGLRGHKVAYVAQSAAASFNPRIRLSNQVIESALIHGTQSLVAAKERAKKLFRYLSLPTPETIGQRFPHQVSGGQLQRFMIAMGLQEEPVLLVCDEPTSALDVTTQVEVLRLLKRAIEDNNTAALFVSHDLGVVAQIATRIAVLHSGKLVEIGTTEEILTHPKAIYTQELLAACKHFSIDSAPQRSPSKRRKGNPLLELRNISASYGPVVVLSEIDLNVQKGEVVAIIGESGSGKSTLARVIAGLHAPKSGTISISDNVLPSGNARSTSDRRRIQLVFQVADTALNPRHTVGRILGRTLKFYHGMVGATARTRMTELLEMVRLPSEYLDRYPGELSGGEKQRVNLARALAAEPEVLICDEITSALDTIVARSIIELLERLRDELGLAIIFISHDLATVAGLADRIVVLRRGVVIESGETWQVLRHSKDPYTRLLASSVPALRVGWLEQAAESRETLERALAAQDAAAA